MSVRQSVRYSCSPLLKISSMSACVTRVQLVREALGRLVALAVDAVHRLLHLVEAGGERARHAPLEDQELRHADRQDLVAVEKTIGLEGRHRAQERRPVVVVERPAHIPRRAGARGTSRRGCARCCPRARGTPQAREIERLAAHDRPVRHAAKRWLRSLTQSRKRVAPAPVPLGVERAHLEPGRVQGLPHLGGDLPAHGVGVLARPVEAADDGAGVVAVKREEVDQRLDRKLRVAREERFGRAGDDERREQVAAAGPCRRKAPDST